MTGAARPARPSPCVDRTTLHAELPDARRRYDVRGPTARSAGGLRRRRARPRRRTRTGEEESVGLRHRARRRAPEAVLISFEFGFLGGSLGERTGDRLEAAYTYAREHRLPVVSLVATGGSRMQEGMLALTQLQRVARQSALTREAGLPQIAVLRDPTTGGGWATLGAGADVVLALPGAQVGFAGSRVRPPDADPAAYTAEAQVAAGAVDAVVPPEELRATLLGAAGCALLTRRPGAAADARGPPGRPPRPRPHAGTCPGHRLGGRTARPRPATPARRAPTWTPTSPARAAISGDRCGGTDPGHAVRLRRARGPDRRLRRPVRHRRPAPPATAPPPG